MILMGLGGSYAYGTNNENSDIDFRGITLNLPSDLLGLTQFEQYEDESTDTVIYSFNKIIKLLLECNPNTIELLGLDEEQYLIKTVLGQELLDHKDLFLSKRAAKSFGGYASAQLRRLQNAIARDSMPQQEREQHIYHSVKNALEDFQRKNEMFDKGRIKIYIDESDNPEYKTEIFIDAEYKHLPLRDYEKMLAAMNNDIKKIIQDKLAEIEKKENIKVLYAVESGSRAWGVESLDSDYDVRFIYVRTREDYLKLEERRDVIEWQLDEVLDINGWDLRKALIQFHKGNATLFEWANSPVVYLETNEWKEIYECCQQYFSEKAALHHYYGTANSTFKQYLQEDKVKYKKYIYALRPLLACRYIESHHAIPPVMFDDLLKQDIPQELSEEIEEMLEIKARDGEQDANPRMPVIHKFIEDEIVRYEQISKDMADDRNSDWEILDHVFLDLIENNPWSD
ncbi:MAG: hypothetical protein HDR20_14405 [Lachnospiraceae bacterium]|nr:hypothetical protein [Lachnospiraceae bacterium]